MQTHIPKTMALVDDDTNILATLSLWAQLRGDIGLTFESAEDLLNAVKNGVGPIDGAILDMNLPGMTGAELSRHLKEINPEMPIVIITGLYEDLMSRRGIVPSGVRCLAKPFDIDELDEAFVEANFPASRPGEFQ